MFQLRACLTIDDATQFCLSLVIKLLAFCDADLEFYASSLDVNTSYYERHAFSRRGLVQLVNLSPMQKEFARPQRIVILTIAMRVRRNVRIEEPGFAFAHRD